jgi:protocatechuate 3,4-dioxygenase beta subunit
LKAALRLKATLLQQGKDTGEADQEIAVKKEELRSALSVITEGLSSETSAETSAEASEVEDQPPDVEKRNLLSKINDHLSEALGIIQKIKEIRGTFRDASRETADDDSVSTSGATSPAEEIGGVITESGAPVEGAVVTDPESGARATTDSSGSYTLRGIAGGRLVNLIIQKGGKKVAAGRVDLPRGRSAMADFDLRGKSTIAAQSCPRIIPSTVMASAAKKGGETGTLKGIVRDAEGRPVARALVKLNGVAMARTDSSGQYTFVNVPAGAHQLVFHKSGLKIKSEKVIVTAKKTSESKVMFAPGDRISKPIDRQPLTLKGTVLRGEVLDESRRAIAGATITLMNSEPAASLVTGLKGNYEFRDLKPGSYMALISKTGYEANTQIISVRQGQVEARDFYLRKKSPDHITQLPKPAQSGGVDRPDLATKPDIQFGRPTAKGGWLVGTIIDVQNRKPVANTSASIEGRRPALTDRDGNYSFADLAPGIYRVRVKSTGYTEQEATIKIVAGSWTRQDFFLKAEVRPHTTMTPDIRSGQVSGRVTDARSGRPLLGVIISFSGHLTVTTNQDGRYSIATLKPGTYQITISKTGFSDIRTTVKVSAGQMIKADFQLSSRGFWPLQQKLPRTG